MKEIFEPRLSSRPVSEQHKQNLNIPRKKQVPPLELKAWKV